MRLLETFVYSVWLTHGWHLTQTIVCYEHRPIRIILILAREGGLYRLVFVTLFRSYGQSMYPSSLLLSDDHQIKLDA